MAGQSITGHHSHTLRGWEKTGDPGGNRIRQVKEYANLTQTITQAQDGIPGAVRWQCYLLMALILRFALLILDKVVKANESKREVF